MVVDGFAKLQAQFVEGWPSVKDPDIEGVFDRFYKIASDRGVTRLMAWLILSGHALRGQKPGMLRRAAERLHSGRVRRAERDGLPVPLLDQSLFGVALLAIIVLGDSLFGPTMRAAVDLRSKEDAARFHRWLFKIVERIDRP